MRTLILLVSVALTFGSTAVGQCVSDENAPVASLTRRVLGINEKSVSDAEITVFDAKRTLLFRTKSDAHGKFSIPRLKSNEYKWLNNDFRVEIHAKGYIRYHYRLLRSANSHKVQPLKLIPESASICNDLKIGEDPGL